MTPNVGGVDRAMRFELGIALLALLLALDGPWRYAGLIGLVPLWTAVSRSCLVNRMLGRNTCRLER